MVGLLVAHLVGRDPRAVPLAIVLCGALAAVDLVGRDDDRVSMSVQVRVGYALLLLLGTRPGWEWVHVMQFVGTGVRVATGYCLLERELRLMPWNAGGPPTLRTVWHTLVAQPSRGGLLRFGTGDEAAALPACEPVMRAEVR